MTLCLQKRSIVFVVNGIDLQFGKSYFLLRVKANKTGGLAYINTSYKDFITD